MIDSSPRHLQLHRKPQGQIQGLTEELRLARLRNRMDEAEIAGLHRDHDKLIQEIQDLRVENQRLQALAQRRP